MNCQNLKLKYEELLNLQNEFQIINAEFQRMKPNTVAERRAVSDELLRKQNNITKFIQENFDSILWKEKIIKREKEVIEKYFGFPVEVPPLPKEITKEKMEFWRENQFELHYSPGIEIKEDNDFPGQKIKLSKDVYRWIKQGKVNFNSIQLPRGWVLVDARLMSWPSELDKMCKNDILATVLTSLRMDGYIQDSEKIKNKGSRFMISKNELDKSEVKRVIAETLAVNQEQLGLPSFSLLNYLGNAFYSQLNNGLWEWFNDHHEVGSGLESSLIGGVSSVMPQSSSCQDGGSGFRPVVYFT